MEGMAYFQFSHPLPGAKLSVVADLHLHQKSALGRRFAPGETFADLVGEGRTTFELSEIFDNYARKNSNKFDKFHGIVLLNMIFLQ
jgi:hypothetical protein